MPGYPAPIVPVGHVQPAPRRVRGVFGGRTVFDTGNARYVWERPAYPQYYIPLADVAGDLLLDEQAERRLPVGAGAHDFPSWQLLPIAGLICFYNEKVDLIVDGERLPRPDPA